ncbi:MAG TPA: glycosyltransferase family 4 protein [Methylomirabilota bacterium]|nr:glycosyltransferase family 4 protein [Methylomirabilota bacterium]
MAVRSVLHVAGSAEWAGGEVYLLQLAQALDRSRFRLSVVAPGDGPLVGRLQAMGVPVFVVPIAEHLLSLPALMALTRLLKRERPHLVQSHGARSNFYSRLACRLAGIPRCVSTVHNSLYDYPVSPGRRVLYLTLDRLTTPLADTIICVAESLARDLIERSRVPARKVVVIQNGVDLTVFHPDRGDGSKIREEFGLGESPVIGMVGRMTPQKNHSDFLKALARVRGAIPQVRALIVGDGPLRQEIEREVAHLGLEAVCRFAGVRQDIADCYAAMDVVVLSSVSEGFPYVVLEALAMARPLVATSVNGVPEIVDDRLNGLLVPPREPAALADAILALLRDPDCARALGQAGRKLVESRFSLERMIHRLQSLYSESTT